MASVARLSVGRYCLDPRNSINYKSFFWCSFLRVSGVHHVDLCSKSSLSLQFMLEKSSPSNSSNRNFKVEFFWFWCCASKAGQRTFPTIVDLHRLSPYINKGYLIAIEFVHTFQTAVPSLYNTSNALWYSIILHQILD